MGFGAVEVSIFILCKVFFNMSEFFCQEKNEGCHFFLSFFLFDNSETIHYRNALQRIVKGKILIRAGDAFLKRSHKVFLSRDPVANIFYFD